MSASVMPSTFLPDDVEALFQELSESHATWAGGAALYGPGGTWDAQRKARLSLYSADIRDGFAERGEKVTEAQLSELAHKHDDYRAFLDKSTTERANWLTLDAERTAIHLKLKFLSYNPIR